MQFAGFCERTRPAIPPDGSSYLAAWSQRAEARASERPQVLLSVREGGTKRGPGPRFGETFKGLTGGITAGMTEEMTGGTTGGMTRGMSGGMAGVMTAGKTGGKTGRMTAKLARALTKDRIGRYKCSAASAPESDDPDPDPVSLDELANLQGGLDLLKTGGSDGAQSATDATDAALEGAQAATNLVGGSVAAAATTEDLDRALKAIFNHKRSPGDAFGADIGGIGSNFR